MGGYPSSLPAEHSRETPEKHSENTHQTSESVGALGLLLFFLFKIIDKKSVYVIYTPKSDQILIRYFLDVSIISVHLFCVVGVIYLVGVLYSMF